MMLHGRGLWLPVSQNQAKNSFVLSLSRKSTGYCAMWNVGRKSKEFLSFYHFPEK